MIGAASGEFGEKDPLYLKCCFFYIIVKTFMRGEKMTILMFVLSVWKICM